MPTKAHSLAALSLLASVATAPTHFGERTVGVKTVKEIKSKLSAAQRKRNKKLRAAKLARKRNRK